MKRQITLLSKLLILPFILLLRHLPHVSGFHYHS
jgi:hypothetical protein